MEVGESVPVTLRKIFGKSVLPALKSSFAEEKEILDERVRAIIQNTEEVCFIGKLYHFSDLLCGGIVWVVAKGLTPRDGA